VKTQPRWRLLLRTLLVVVVLPYAGILVWLKTQESEMVFQTALSQGRAVMRDPAPLASGSTGIALPDGQALHGLLLEPDPASSRGYWILHLHGNADSAFSPGQVRHAMALRDQGFHVLAFDYRGFGDTPGEASEAGMYKDAEAAFQWLREKGVPAGKIILWGHSLGSGPAVELATRHPIAGLLLFGAFTSIPDRGAELYPWLPVRWIAGIRFPNLDRIHNVHVPVVLVHAVTDLTIPFSHSERLFAAANEPKRLLRLDALSDDGLGGHVTAAYEQLDRVVPAMEEVMGAGRPGP
jgi:uncharacterized protein